MSILLFENGHITDAGFDALQQDRLSAEEREQMLTHLSMCDVCEQRMIEKLESTELSTPPFLASRIAAYVQDHGGEEPCRHPRLAQIGRLAVAMALMMAMLYGGMTYMSAHELPTSPPIHATQIHPAEKQKPQKESAFARLEKKFAAFADAFGCNYEFMGEDQHDAK